MTERHLPQSTLRPQSVLINGMLIVTVVLAGLYGLRQVEREANVIVDARVRSSAKVAADLVELFVGADRGDQTGAGGVSDTRGRELEAALERIVSDSIGRALIVDDGFRVLASAPDPVRRGTSIDQVDPQLGQAIRSGDRRVGEGEETSRLASVPVGNSGWRLVISLPEEETIRGAFPLRRVLRVQTLYLLIAFASAGLLAWRLAKTNRNLRIANLDLIASEKVHEADLRVMGRLNDSLGVFSRTAAHDLRNPLSTIRMWSDLLEKEVEGSSEIAQQAVEFIRSGSDRGLRLVTDLLAYAQAGAVPNKEAREMSEVVAAAVSASGVDGVMQHVDSGAVVADQLSLQQALINLLINARKYAPGSLVSIEAERYVGGWSISVTDDGPGVDPEIEETLFDPFVRGEGSTSAESSGLGLSLVARFAESHGGTVGYSRPPAGGSRFMIRLPDPESTT